MKYFYMLMSLYLFSCSNQYTYDATMVANQYCTCMKKNGAPQDYWYAKKVCDGLLTKKYYFFRVMEVDIKIKEYEHLSSGLIDSVKTFKFEFEDNLKHSCCKTVNNCMDGQKRPENSAKGL